MVIPSQLLPQAGILRPTAQHVAAQLLLERLQEGTHYLARRFSPF